MLLSAFGQRGMHLNAHLNSVHFVMLALAILLTPSAISFSCAPAAGMPLYGNVDIVLVMVEIVFEQGERSKAMSKGKWSILVKEGIQRLSTVALASIVLLMPPPQISPVPGDKPPPAFLGPRAAPLKGGLICRDLE